MKTLLTLFFFAAFGIYLAVSGLITPESIRQGVITAGPWAPLAFIGLFMIAPLMPFFSAVLAMAGGLVFGLWFGSLYIMIGAFLGASIGFFLARQYGAWLRSCFKVLSKPELEALLNENGFILVLILRLVPLFPFDVVSHMAGFSQITYGRYIVATMLGIIPGVLVYANIGANVLHLNSAAFYISISLLVLLAIVSLWLKKTVLKRFS